MPSSTDLQTRLIHADEGVDDDPAISPPIYQTSNYLFPSAEEGARLSAEVAPEHYYTRYGSPNGKR
jgi:cystathionine beta-lyase/cystathionine gamma-synthase